MLGFAIGIVTGIFLGVIVMCLILITKTEDDGLR